MAVLANNARLIKVGQDYSAGSGISIDDYVISVTGEFGKTYSAGENIGIYEQDNQLYISGKDWTQDISNSYTSAVDWVSSQGYYIGNISTANSGSLYNINVNGLDVYGITSTSSDKHYINSFSGNGFRYSISFGYPIQVGDYNTGTWSQWSASDTISFSSDGVGILPRSKPIKVKYIVTEQAGGSIQSGFSGDIGEISYEHNEVNAPFIKPSWLTSGAFIYLKFESDDTHSYGDLASNSWTLSMGNVEGDTISGLIINDNAEVNEFVYNNSASILITDFTYQQNSASYLTAHQEISSKLDVTAFSTVSGDFLTAFPSNMATTGDVAELAQTIRETYQTKGDYLTTADSANFYPANNPSGFITGVDLSNFYTKDETSGKTELADEFSKYATSSWVESKDPVLVGDSNITATSSKVDNHTQWNLAINSEPIVTDTRLTGENCVTAHTTDVSGEWAVGLVQSAYEAINAIDGINTDVESLKSASSNWAYTSALNNLTNDFNSLSSNVNSNSGTWNEISAYQSASGTYLTAHQSLDDYATKAEVDTVSSLLSAGLDYVSANAGGNVPVSNSGDLYKVEFDGVDLYGVKSTSSTPNYAYSALSSSDAFVLYNISPYPTFDNEPFYEGLYNWSAFDIISISSNGGQIIPSSSQEYGATALDVYYKANGLWDYNSNILDGFSGYIGKITNDNLFISSYFDKPNYYDSISRGEIQLWFSSNIDSLYLDNYCICSVGNKVQTGTNTISGIFVPTLTFHYVEI